MAAKSSNSSAVPGPPEAAAEERHAGPHDSVGNGDDENSVYDEFIRQAARAPEVEPAHLEELSERAAQASLEGKRLGHFRVLARLGSGGMGVVYRAEDEILRRPVALKVLSAWLSGSARSHSLLEEARHAAAVSHPNIAAIYEVGEADGMAFIA
ncbi:MAG TPA: hypothetical protein VK420_21375, partial [Longimicrobium sp.]|nr:hypothetical protein [Longimicrobium sp.]